MKYLINQKEADTLAKLVKQNNAADKLGYDSKIPRSVSNFPFRFKLLENMSTTVAAKANAAIWFFGGSTTQLHATDYVVDDSSQFSAMVAGNRGVCLASSEYFILSFDSTAVNQPCREYMGLASTSYTSTQLSVVIDNLEAMQGVATTLTTLTVNNRFAWNIVNNADCYARYNDYTSEYDLIQTKCT